MRRAVPLLVLIALSICLSSAPAASAGTSRSTARSASGPIVLGSKSYWAPQARGWGTVKPKTIFNGGDPGGLVSHIRWHHWGRKSAIGWGLTSIFKPTGGYYPRLVHAELRATDIGHCGGRGPLAYRRLAARVPSHPGGPLQSWFRWAGTGNICRAP